MPVSGRTAVATGGLVIKLSRLPEEATHEELETAIAAVLHKSTQAQDRLVNFKLEMKLHYSSVRNVGYARVILPGERWCSLLIQKKQDLQVRGRQVRVEYAQCDPPPRSTVLFLQRTAYDDGQAVRLLERQREQLQGEVHVDAVALGVIQLQRGASETQPQPVFSTEWSMSGHRCVLTFEDNLEESHRGFRVSFGDHSDSELRSIVVRTSTVASITYGHDYGPFVLFCLSCPPAYEVCGNVLTSTGARRTPSAIRQRMSCIDGRHTSAAPYAFHLLVRPLKDFQEILSKARVAKLPPFLNADARGALSWQFDARGCYSPNNLARLRSWLVGMDIRTAFQLQALVSNVLVDPVTLLQGSLRSSLDRLIKSHTPEDASGILREFRRLVQHKLQPAVLAGDVGLLQKLLDSAIESHMEQSKRVRELLDSDRRRRGTADSVVFCHHVTVTPTGFRLDGPNPIKANRVLRQYDSKRHFFLRVKFTDEAHLQFRWHREVDGRRFVEERVGSILKTGLEVAGRDYRFLGYSLSALHTYSAWFLTDFYEDVQCADCATVDRVRVTPEYIRSHIGNFSEVMNFPSLFGARMALAFSATDSTVKLDETEIIAIEDIYSEEGSLMSDGCGTVSPELAVEINGMLFSNARIAEWEDVVNVYQFRLGGAKGVISVDMRLRGRQLCLRPSMIKFAASSRDIEIANYARPSRMYLNRPLVMTLETLGVQRRTFMRLQEAVIRDAHTAATSIRDFIPILGKLGSQYSLRYVLEQLTDIQCGFRDDCSDTDGIVLDDYFFTEMVQSVLWETLRSIKYNARIAVPESWTLIGLVDDHNILEEGQVMAYILNEEYKNGKWLEGPALISRSPVMAPSDCQMVTAISPPMGSQPAKSPLVNSIVFSAKGSQSLASCLAAGDFDGDSYHISQHEGLFIRNPQPPVQATEKVERRRIQGRNGNINDVADFFVDYINNDTVGLLARQHLIIADQSNRGVKSSKCLELSEMYSRAVDFPKTGRSVPTDDMPRLDFGAKPDWITNEGEEDENGGVYRSDKALGFLYRAVEATKLEDVAVGPPTQAPATLEHNLTSVLEPRVAVFITPDAPVPPALRHEIESLYLFYTNEMRRIAGLYTLHSKAPLKEMEVMLGCILARSSQPKKRKQLAALMHVHSGWLSDLVSGQLLKGLDAAPEACLFKSWAAWQYACERPAEDVKGTVRKPFGARSFGVLALAGIFRAIDKLELHP